MKMRYSVEPKDLIHVKGYEFLSFSKSLGKKLSNKCSQKLLNIDLVKTASTTDAVKYASKRVIQKTAKSAGNLIRIKIVDKITKSLKKSS